MADINDIIDYENGDMTEKQFIDFFQALIDSGECWQFQGHYGRMATLLIKAGACEPSEH